MVNGSYYLVVKKFLQINDFYNIAISSSALNTFKCSQLSSDVFVVHINEVRVKCYRMPFYNQISMDESSSDDENYSETTQYIITAIIHSDKI